MDRIGTIENRWDRHRTEDQWNSGKKECIKQNRTNRRGVKQSTAQQNQVKKQRRKVISNKLFLRHNFTATHVDKTYCQRTPPSEDYTFKLNISSDSVPLNLVL